MVAWMNQAALTQTLESGWATFYSRSRQELWQKGATSGNRLRVHGVSIDCDGDTLLVSVDPEGPSCHTGRPSCFFQSVAGQTQDPAPYLLELERVIAERASSVDARSYTRSLVESGVEKITAKIREEADEFACALQGESNDRVSSEAADVLFHLLVGLRARGVALHEVIAELARRAGTSGLDEKAARANTGGGGPQPV